MKDCTRVTQCVHNRGPARATGASRAPSHFFRSSPTFMSCRPVKMWPKNQWLRSSLSLPFSSAEHAWPPGDVADAYHFPSHRMRAAFHLHRRQPYPQLLFCLCAPKITATIFSWLSYIRSLTAACPSATTPARSNWASSNTILVTTESPRTCWPSHPPLGALPCPSSPIRQPHSSNTRPCCVGLPLLHPVAARAVRTLSVDGPQTRLLQDISPGYAGGPREDPFHPLRWIQSSQYLPLWPPRNIDPAAALGSRPGAA